MHFGYDRTNYPRCLFPYVLKTPRLRLFPGQLRLRRRAARLAGFGIAAPGECSYCVVIIKKPLELGVQKIKTGY